MLLSSVCQQENVSKVLEIISGINLAELRFSLVSMQDGKLKKGEIL